MSVSSMLEFEESLWRESVAPVAGLDEAGRGPWAGPVVAAAVCFDPDYVRGAVSGELDGLTDSKKLSKAKREIFFDLLTHSPHLGFGLGEASPEEIDRLNILRATHLAMNRALEALPVAPAHVLVDGRPVKSLAPPSTAIVKGDAKSLSIAAASVIAKVTRDRILVKLDETFPGYGFSKHKGYGTRIHQEALAEHGPCACHRRSFKPIARLFEPELFGEAET